MIRILHLALLLIPTVLSAKFDVRDCSKDKYACIIQDVCKGDSPENKMVLTKTGALNYQENTCKVHVMMKQFSTSSYWIRFIASTDNIKLVQDQDFIGCELKKGNLNVTTSKPESINLKLIPNKNIPRGNGEEMDCEFSVVYTNGDKVFPDGKEMIVEYNNERLTIDENLIKKMTKEFDEESYKCDPYSIGMDRDRFEEHGYFIKPITADINKISCANNKKYTMAFMNSDGNIEEAKEIICDQEKKNGCESSGTCEWKYFITHKGTTDKIVAPDDFKAACRQRVCKMCNNQPKCEGTGCKSPVFSTKGECHTLTCGHEYDKKYIVAIDGGKKTFGQFKCSPDDQKDNKEDGDAVWTFEDIRGNSRKFTTATCFDSIECNENQPIIFKCQNEEKKEGCPQVDVKTNIVKCLKGFDLKVNDGSNEINPIKVQCDTKKGVYHYTSFEGSTPVEIRNNETVVSCIRQDAVAAATGMPLWQWILFAVVAIILIALLILCIFCVRRSKKKEEERKALLKRNDSAPSSTESGQPQMNRNRVHLQPCSTAKPISSEQISEATAIEKTKKEYVEKTMIEPTIDPTTAHSHDKSRQSKRETGSVEAEIIDDGKRSRSQKSTERIPDKEESAPSGKFTQTSKKESGKDDKIKPKKFELNEKEKQIAKGVWRRNEDYPTMADIESDWDDEKDGKPPSKQRTATKDIPTADTPSNRVVKIPDLNEKTAEMDRLIAQPLSPLKLQRVTASEDVPPAGSRESDSRASVRRTTKRISTLMATLDATQDQK